MSSGRSGLSMFMIGVAAVILLSGCGERSVSGAASAREDSSPATSTPAATETTTTSPDVARVSYATICPDLIDHGSSSADLVTEFVNDAQTLADKGAATTTRFDSVIEDLEYDVAAAPVELVPYIQEQVATMTELRDYLQVGGTRNTEFRRYKSASMEILNQCAAFI